MGKQTWTRQSAVDRPSWSGRLHDALATCASELRPYMTNHLEACGNTFQLFGDIFAKLAQRTTAIGAAVVRRKMSHHFTRKILGKWLACRVRPALRFSPSRSRFRCFGCGLSSFFGSLSSLQFFEPELKLFEFSAQLLALAAEDHPPVLFDDQLQMFDLMCVRCQFLV